MKIDSTARPSDVTYWAYWLPWLVAAGNIIYLAIWATLTTYIAEEQALIRRVQFHPVLETGFVKSVDEIGEQIDGAETVAGEYAALATGQPPPISSNIDLRYLILMLKNRGEGIIDSIEFEAEILVPQTSFRKTLGFDKQVNLARNEQQAFVIAPIWNLPRYEVALRALKYKDFFGSYSRAAGKQKIIESRPFDLPTSQKRTIFVEDFADLPQGKGWFIDYWGKGAPSNLMYIEHTKPDRHVLVFRGTQDEWDQVRGNMGQQSGAYLDFHNLPPETTFEISARVKSEPGTTGKFRIWCHDVNWLVNNKDRDTGDKTPIAGDQFETVSMFYTTTDSGRLRVHLHYVPGAGAIEIDSLVLRQLVQ